jgi:hypothetical protein
MKLESYRPTMAEDVLHSWAEEAQNKLEALEALITELTGCLEGTYSGSPEGRAYLKMARAVRDS